MNRLLVDADAWNAMRKLSILDMLVALGTPIVLTEYIARQELNDLQREISDLVAQGAISIEPVGLTSARRNERKKLRGEGVHKGEIEAMFWLDDQPVDDRPDFVSCDVNARKLAKKRGLVARDVMDVVVLLVEASASKNDAQQQVAEKLAVWDDRRQMLCRPRDWEGFEKTYKARRASILPPSS